MRRDDTLIQAFPAFQATMIASDGDGQTSYGNSIDVTGFRQVLAVLCVGQVRGTNAGTATVSAAFEESVNPTGPFTAIGNGKINGTMAFTDIAVLGNTSYGSVAKLSERFDDPNRSRYIRCRATVASTADAKFFIPLGVTVWATEPPDTYYITQPATLATGNAQAYGGVYSTF